MATFHRLVVIALSHGLEMGRCARLHRKIGALSAQLVLLFHLSQGKALFYFTSRYALRCIVTSIFVGVFLFTFIWQTNIDAVQRLLVCGELLCAFVAQRAYPRGALFPDGGHHLRGRVVQSRRVDTRGVK